VQLGRWEYYCTVCGENSFQAVDDGCFVCLRSPQHPLIVSARCLNREPKKCGGQSAKGDCAPLSDVRRMKPEEKCAMICGGPGDENPYVVQWDCGHVMCVPCFRETNANVLYCKNLDGNWVPQCRLCQVPALQEPVAQRCAALGRCGAVSLVTCKLLPRETYSRIKDKGAELHLGEEREGVVCTRCNAVNMAAEPFFPCGRCDAVLCRECRTSRSTCMCSTDPNVLLQNLRAFYEKHMWMSCPRCRSEQPVKDDACNHVRCERCGLEYCYACGRSLHGEGGLSTCPKHRLNELMFRIEGEEPVGLIVAEIEAWRATTWEHAFFLMRAYVVVTKFFALLSAEQAARLRAERCPITDWLAAKEELVHYDRGYVAGEGADKFLGVSEQGWDAFLGARAGLAVMLGLRARPTAELLEIAARTHFPQWFEDIAEFYQ
jgi:ribosomal protein S27E